MEYKKEIASIRADLCNYIKSNKIKSLVVGVSGGIDSALICALVLPVCESLKIPLIGRSLPADSNADNETERAALVGEAFCDSFRIQGIEYAKDNLRELMTSGEVGFQGNNTLHEDRIRMGNIKARIRMIYLYDLAQKHHGLVLSTDNLTEYYLGFWTLHGDVGDYGPIQHLWKTEVYEISEFLARALSGKKKEALRLCIKAIPTDGLGISDSDVDQIMPGWNKKYKNCREAYAAVDKILDLYTNEGECCRTQRTKKLKKTPVIQRYLVTKFKRKGPISKLNPA